MLEAVHEAIDDAGGPAFSHLGQMGIDGRGLRRVVAEILLHQPEIDTLLDEMCGVRMAQGAHRCSLVDLALAQGGFESGLYVGVWRWPSCRAELVVFATTSGRGKEPFWIAVAFPVVAQHLQGFVWQRHKAIFTIFALHDVHDHALTVDVRDLEITAFEQAQTAGVDSQETDAVTLESNAGKDAANLRACEHDGHALFAAGAHEGQGWPVAFDGVLIEELDAAQGDGAGGSRPFLDILDVQEVVAQFFFSDLVRRLVVVFGEFTHGAQIHLLRAFGIAAQLQILQHAFFELGHNIPP